jgi:tRNA(adenine34) deaminase
MHRSNEYFMGCAPREATSGLDAGELPIGAVVVLDDEIIASAHTREVSEGRLLVHADLLALEAADRLKLPFEKRRRSTLFVTGEPCLMCMGAAMSFFIGEIVYGHESPSDGAVALVTEWAPDPKLFPNYRIPNIVGGVLRVEAIDLVKEYVKRHTSGAMWEWAKTIAELEEWPST